MNKELSDTKWEEMYNEKLYVPQYLVNCTGKSTKYDPFNIRNLPPFICSVLHLQPKPGTPVGRTYKWYTFKPS